MQNNTNYPNTCTRKLTINKNMLDACYYLFLNQFYLSHNDNHVVAIKELREKLYLLSLELDDMKIPYYKQNRIAFLADSKQYYYKNSESTIRKDIKKILEL